MPPPRITSPNTRIRCADLNSDEFRTMATLTGSAGPAFIVHEISAIKSGVCDLNHSAVDLAAARLEAARKSPFCEVRHDRDCKARDCESGPAEPRIASQNGRLLARGQLSFRRPDLSQRQSSAGAAADAGRREAAAAGSLGHHAGPEFSLRALEPADPRARAEHDLRHRPGTRRTGDGGEHLS